MRTQLIIQALNVIMFRYKSGPIYYAFREARNLHILHLFSSVMSELRSRLVLEKHNNLKKFQFSQGLILLQYHLIIFLMSKVETC